MPIAVKDNVDVSGELTTHGAGGNPTAATTDSEVVRRLRSAGAVILGKTALCELAAYGHFTSSATHGVTRNPWNLDRSPGGSSGGSAAAVAAGMVPVALGSDGGGSIRIPSAFCGLFGLKPQRGRVPLAPLDDHWYGCTVLGGIGRSVLDVAIFDDTISGVLNSGGDGSLAAAATRHLDRLRIAVSLKAAIPGVKPSPQAIAAIEQTTELLQSLGHVVDAHELAHPQLLTTFTPRWAAGIRDDALAHADDLERRTRQMAGLGRAARRTRSETQHRARARRGRASQCRVRRVRPGDDAGHCRPATERRDLANRGRAAHLQPEQPVRLLHADLELPRTTGGVDPRRFRPRRPPAGDPARRATGQRDDDRLTRRPDRGRHTVDKGATGFRHEHPLITTTETGAPSMSQHDNIQIVKDIYDAVGRGDLDAILEQVTDDVDWAADVAGTAAPWHGPRAGKQGVASFFEDINNSIEITEFLPHSYAAGDGDVHLLVDWTFRPLANGRQTSMTMHHYWQLRDGKVARFRGSEDSALTAQAFAR